MEVVQGREVTITFDGKRCVHSRGCGCGQAGNKPYCHGSHERAGFLAAMGRGWGQASPISRGSNGYFVRFSHPVSVIST